MTMVRSEDIKNSVDIAEVIKAHGVELKNNRACCPFHSEKTPSFFVNTKKQYFHCFGCGAGGDVITFVMKICGCDFKTAIRYLAENYKVDINTPEAIANRANAKRKQAFSEWKEKIWDLMYNAQKNAHTLLTLEKPVFSLDEVSDDYLYIINHIDLLELYMELFIGSEESFYKNYRKEAEVLARNIRNRCGS